jgi:micrococcal nuclease
MLFSHHLRQALVSLAFFLLAAASANAGTLFGTVTEIDDGDTITLICLKRPLKVHLVGIEAPDPDQPYADVARQHLSDLILNKIVVVHYSGLGDNALILGKVILKDTDIGAQMLRDGVAWYDKNYDNLLTENQRQVYAASELAARNERRGIWQDSNPISPWDFRESRRLGEMSKPSPSVKAPPVVQRKQKSELTSENLSPSFASSGAFSLSTSDAVPISSDSEWIRLTQPEAKASMLVPGSGSQRSSKVLLEDGRVLTSHTYLGRFDKTTYVVVSSMGVDAKESDLEVLDGSIRGFVSGIQSEWQKLGSKFECYPALDQNFSVSGFAARQYDLTGCTVPGRVRFFTRVVNNVRELYLAAAFYFGPSDDPNAIRFFNSFAENKPSRPASNKAKPVLSTTSSNKIKN